MTGLDRDTEAFLRRQRTARVLGFIGAMCLLSGAMTASIRLAGLGMALIVLGVLAER